SGQAPIAESKGTDPLEGVLPEPGSQVVTLGDDGQESKITAPSTDAAAGSKLQAEVLDQAAARSAGVSGFVFKLSGADGSASMMDIGGRAGLPASLSVDYSAFERSFGAGYGDRLQVVALPACA